MDENELRKAHKPLSENTARSEAAEALKVASEGRSTVWLTFGETGQTNWPGRLDSRCLLSGARAAEARCLPFRFFRLFLTSSSGVSDGASRQLLGAAG